MNNDDQMESIKERIIEQIASNMQLYGVQPTVGRLMGTIYYNREPMTLDEMKEELGMSKMRMSTAVRELTDLNLAKKVFQKGSRKNLYTSEQDYYQTFINLFSSNWRKGIGMNRTFSQKLIVELNDIIDDEESDQEKKDQAREYLEETEKILEFYDWLDELVECFESNEIFRYIPKKNTQKHE